MNVSIDCPFRILLLFILDIFPRSISTIKHLCCVSRLFSFLANQILAKKNEFLIVLNHSILLLCFIKCTSQFCFLDGFVKANLHICLSWIWTFDIDIISTSCVDDNATCVLADHIDPIVRDWPTQHYLIYRAQNANKNTKVNGTQVLLE